MAIISNNLAKRKIPTNTVKTVKKTQLRKLNKTIQKKLFSSRDISWLSFNNRVLQEAMDKSNPLHERLRFLGIFSNNLDEFFRVRVPIIAKLAMFKVQNASKVEAEKVFQEIKNTVAEQQLLFDTTLAEILQEMAQRKIFLVNAEQLSATEKQFVEHYFESEVRSYILPLMIESINVLPPLNEKNLHLACVLGNSNMPLLQTYALIEVPADTLPRFVELPVARNGNKKIILLEDVIRTCLPLLFAQFSFNTYHSSIIKITKNADLELDQELNSDLLAGLEKGIKRRTKAKTSRFIYQNNIDARLLNYLLGLLQLKKNDSVLQGGSIHNFKDFMDFPAQLFDKIDVSPRKPSMTHPLLLQPKRIMSVLDKQDVLLHIPYHSFDSIIDLLREASIDPYVTEIKITCYRLAKRSKIANALINAARNGKKVTVIIELRARFDEAANIQWMRYLQEEGVEVHNSKNAMKIHSKICLITRKELNVSKHYGFVGSGNLNERTAKIYADHFLLTSNQNILSEAHTLFEYMTGFVAINALKKFKHIVVSPVQTRNHFLGEINKSIHLAKAGKSAKMIIKVNSFSDPGLLAAVRKAIIANVEVDLIVRGVFCLNTNFVKKPKHFNAISLVDSYLEHSRIFYFERNEQRKVYLGSADWMVRNLDYRIEVSVPVLQADLQDELKTYLELQLLENQKARILDNSMDNKHKKTLGVHKKVRAQVAIFKYLSEKKYTLA